MMKKLMMLIMLALLCVVLTACAGFDVEIKNPEGETIFETDDIKNGEATRSPEEQGIYSTEEAEAIIDSAKYAAVAIARSTGNLPNHESKTHLELIYPNEADLNSLKNFIIQMAAQSANGFDKSFYSKDFYRDENLVYHITEEGIMTAMEDILGITDIEHQWLEMEGYDAEKGEYTTGLEFGSGNNWGCSEIISCEIDEETETATVLFNMENNFYGASGMEDENEIETLPCKSIFEIVRKENGKLFLRFITMEYETEGSRLRNFVKSYDTAENLCKEYSAEKAEICCLGEDTVTYKLTYSEEKKEFRNFKITENDEGFELTYHSTHEEVSFWPSEKGGYSAEELAPVSYWEASGIEKPKRTEKMGMTEPFVGGGPLFVTEGEINTVLSMAEHINVTRCERFFTEEEILLEKNLSKSLEWYSSKEAEEPFFELFYESVSGTNGKIFWESSNPFSSVFDRFLRRTEGAGISAFNEPEYEFYTEAEQPFISDVPEFDEEDFLGEFRAFAENENNFSKPSDLRGCHVDSVVFNNALQHIFENNEENWKEGTSILLIPTELLDEIAAKIYGIKNYSEHYINWEYPFMPNSGTREIYNEEKSAIEWETARGGPYINYKAEIISTEGNKVIATAAFYDLDNNTFEGRPFYKLRYEFIRFTCEGETVYRPVSIKYIYEE